MSLWHKCIHVPQPSPGGSTVSIPPQGAVLTLWGSGDQLSLAGDRIETDGGTE